MALDTIEVARAEIAQIYIAAFNRVPDAAGLSNWMNQYMAGKMTYAQIAEDFTRQPEYTAKYPSIMTNTEYVTEIYNNVFGRTPDAGGLVNWVNQLDHTSITGINRGNIMTYMLASAGAPGNTDGERLDNQAEFAVQSILDGVPTATATAQLANITADTATVTAATAAVSGEAGNVLGDTFTLTKNVDAFTGTSDNDTFVANYDAQATAAHTLGGLDTLNGAAGTDTLAITDTTAGFTLAGATISNIEKMTIRASGTVTADASGANVTGLTNLSVTQAAGAVALTAGATTDVNVSGNVHATATIATTGGKTVTVDHKLDSAGDAISVNGAVNVNVTATDVINAAGINIGTTTANTGTVAVQASGAAVVAGTVTASMDAIAVTGGTTITVNQDATSSMGTIATAPLTGGAATITQGAVTVVAGNTTTAVTVTQDDQATAANAVVAVAAVKQTQTVTFNALVAGNTVTVNGLTFTATKNLTAAEVAAAFANLTSGDRQDDGGPTANGIYTGINTAGTFTTGAAVGNTVVYSEVTANTNAGALVPATAQGTGTTAPTAPTAVISNAGSGATAAVTGVLGVANGAVLINDNAVKSITTVTVDGYSAGATIGGVSALDAITTLTLKNSGAGAALLHTGSTGALTLNLTDVDGTVSIDGTAATITNLTINTSGVASTGAITAAAATTVTINAEAALSGAHVLTAATLIDVNGSAAVDLTGATTNAVTLATIDASGNAGGVTAVLGGTNSVKFTGGTGNDSLTLGAAAIATGKNIDMGAGNDTLVVFASTTAATIVGTVTGGEGTDTLSMGYADAVAVSANTDFDAEVANFERLTINDLATDDDNTDAETVTVNLANLTYNYVTVNGTVGAVNGDLDILAFTNMAANGTVAFGTSTAASLYTVALADAAGGTDAINYVLASTGLSVATNVVDSTLGTAITAGTITTNAVETFNISSTAVDVDGAQNTITANGNTVTSIVVTGNAGLTLASTATTLTTVDASALTAGTLIFTASNASMTVKGGAGADSITIAATADSGTFYGNAGVDTFAIAAGADLVTIYGGTGADVFDFNGVSTNKSNFVVLNGVDSGDKLDFASITDGTPATTFASARITLSVGATESTQAYLDQAMTQLAENGFGWFQYNGNTYIAGDVGTADSANSFVDGSDFVTMITGLVDLSTASFNATTGVLEIA